MSHLFLLLLLLVSCDLSAEVATFELTGEARPVAQSNRQVITETTWRMTERSSESIQIHRYLSADQAPVATLLYLPGTNMNGALKVMDEDHNLWLYLAGRGIAVYTLSYRTHFIGHDYPGDLDFMRDWTLDLFHEDAVSAGAKVLLDYPDKPLYVAGFSHGALFAYTVTGQLDVSGVIALDGYVKDYRESLFDLAGSLQTFDSQGDYATVLSRRGYRGRDELMRRAIDEPDAPAADNRFDSASAELSAILYRAWGPGVLANTRDEVSPLSVLATELRGYDWFFPSIHRIESQSLRSSADDPNTYIDDHLGNTTVPVIYFGSGRSGAEQLLNGIYSAKLMGGDDVAIHVLEDYGHLDVLYANQATTYVYKEILDWIMADIPSVED